MTKHHAPDTQSLRPGPPESKRAVKVNGEEVVLLARIELAASPLPRECSTTELQQLEMAFGDPAAPSNAARL
jgi:hypothetical protein